MSVELPVVLRVRERHARKVRYVLDTLTLAADVTPVPVDAPPASGPWLFYGAVADPAWPLSRCLAIPYSEPAWDFFGEAHEIARVERIQGLSVPLPQRPVLQGVDTAIAFDLAANAFFFLSSWSERRGSAPGTRRLHADSVYARLGIEQDIVDRYLSLLIRGLVDTIGTDRLTPANLCVRWPQRARYALVLSHDVDYLPRGPVDLAAQGARTLLRHLVRQRDPLDAVQATFGLARCVLQRRDPYGCVPWIIAQEKRLGVRSSFQVAVARRHPADVNYDVGDDATRDYLRTIVDEGFDLCLHGSYRSTESAEWYAGEVELLAGRLQRPVGNRQHFLSFDYDTLFAAQERAGIEYDMSMGFPDRPGPRSGFSFPYRPYCLAEDRPYDVLQLGLAVMDVTLRGYLGLRGARAWPAIESALAMLRDVGGCSSVVWHPIVFGGARDPGYEHLYWRLVEHVGQTGGLATDGRTINRFWRERSGARPTLAE